MTLEVANYANALRFLVDLLKNMKAVLDPLLKLIPQLEAKREVVAFEDPTDIPPNAPPNVFVNNYFGGLYVMQKAMIGKFWFVSQHELPVFKKSKQFQDWLDGGHAGHHIQLDMSTLAGCEQHAVGIFLNAVTRHDSTQNFHDFLHKKLLSHPDLSGEVFPKYQISVKTMFRQRGED